MDFIKKFFFSTRLMAVLFIAFAVSMALGTFIESAYSTETARIWIYNTWWFEAIMAFFMINFIGNINKYKLLRKEKWAVLTLHLSWILIILGAFVTRYVSYEGMMPIREGASEHVFYSNKTYISLTVDGFRNGELQRRSFQDEILVTPEAIKSSLPWNSNFDGKEFSVSFVRFEKGMIRSIVEDENGDEYLKLVTTSSSGRDEHFIKSGEVESIHNLLVALNNPTQGAINITTTGDSYTINSPFDGGFMRMADQYNGTVVANQTDDLQLRSLYNFGDIQFVIPQPMIKGSYQLVKASKDNQFEAKDALTVFVQVGDESTELTVLSTKGESSISDKIVLNGLNFRLGYGSATLDLPFSIKLNDFIAQRYPGTQKGYSSFMSKITVEDEKPFDYDIYMNHILDHKGYRFFQSSFDPDEKGTVLSVNHDAIGTGITYLGYILLYIGMIGAFFFGDTRFKQLSQSLRKLKNKKTGLGVLLALMSLSTAFSQEHEDEHTQIVNQEQILASIKSTIVSEEHAEAFGHLVIQDDNGRMKPINTYASELLRKLSYKDKFEGYNADQVFISMQLYPAAWYNAEFIALDKKGQNDSLRKIIGVQKGKRLVKATDFFDQKGNYKLAPFLQEAYSTNTPNQFQKDFKEIDLKLGLLNRALSGEIARVFPLPNDENNKWISAVAYQTGEYQVRDSLYGNFIKNGFSYYLMNLRNALETSDYTDANKVLEALKINQETYGAQVMPSVSKINAEITYNHWDVFNRLYHYYIMWAVLLFIVVILSLFKERKLYTYLTYGLTGFIWISFIVHTLGLGFRWYISGHAPWSDAYESILYVAWATLGMGLVLGRKSGLTVASSVFVTSMLLWIAHQSWVDPSIANLQPVLNSYWLMIHVAIIVASYGPLSVGMILGFVTMLLMILSTKKTKEKIEYKIKELTILNELTLTVGLVMLTIGNFLGGMWANESWGRYWGWDPKETWALISIMVYAFVIHARLVPGLRGKWAFSFMSVIAYASIMMTYFGVNFYLVGLHSYASGEQVITPNFIYYTVFVVLLIGLISNIRYRRLK